MITLEHCPEGKHQHVWLQDEMHVVYRVGNHVFRPARDGTGNKLPVTPKQLTLVEQPHLVTDLKQLPNHRIIMARKLHSADPVDYLWFHVDGRWYSACCDLDNNVAPGAVENTYAFAPTTIGPVANRFTVTDYVAAWQTTHIKIPVKSIAAVPSWIQPAQDKQRELDAALEDIRAVAADDASRREVDSQELPVAVG